MPEQLPNHPNVVTAKSDAISHTGLRDRELNDGTLLRTAPPARESDAAPGTISFIHASR